MKNYQQPGKSITLTAPSGGVTSGVAVLIGAILVVPITSADEGESFAGYTEGVISHEKVGSQAWTEGAAVYWDVSEAEFTTTASGNYLAGVAVEAVGSGAGETTGKVRLNGIATFVES